MEWVNFSTPLIAFIMWDENPKLFESINNVINYSGFHYIFEIFLFRWNWIFLHVKMAATEYSTFFVRYIFMRMYRFWYFHFLLLQSLFSIQLSSWELYFSFIAYFQATYLYPTSTWGNFQVTSFAIVAFIFLFQPILSTIDVVATFLLQKFIQHYPSRWILCFTRKCSMVGQKTDHIDVSSMFLLFLILYHKWPVRFDNHDSNRKWRIKVILHYYVIY